MTKPKFQNLRSSARMALGAVLAIAIVGCAGDQSGWPKTVYEGPYPFYDDPTIDVTKETVELPTDMSPSIELQLNQNLFAHGPNGKIVKDLAENRGVMTVSPQENSLKIYDLGLGRPFYGIIYTISNKAGSPNYAIYELPDSAWNLANMPVSVREKRQTLIDTCEMYKSEEEISRILSWGQYYLIEEEAPELVKAGRKFSIAGDDTPYWRVVVSCTELVDASFFPFILAVDGQDYFVSQYVPQPLMELKQFQHDIDEDFEFIPISNGSHGKLIWKSE